MPLSLILLILALAIPLAVIIIPFLYWDKVKELFLSKNNKNNISIFVDDRTQILQNIQLTTEDNSNSVLTYESVIKYFVDHRPDNPSVEKGAILRQLNYSEQTIVQLFIDRENDLVCMPNGKPYGRKIIAQKLDQELLDAFDGKDLIIVE